MVGQPSITISLSFAKSGEGTCGFCEQWTPGLFQVSMKVGGKEDVIEKDGYPFEVCSSCRSKLRIHLDNIQPKVILEGGGGER